MVVSKVVVVLIPVIIISSFEASDVFLLGASNTEHDWEDNT